MQDDLRLQSRQGRSGFSTTGYHLHGTGEKQKAGTNDHAHFALITGSGFQSSGLVRYPR
jgi:hypothetical protein